MRQRERMSVVFPDSVICSWSCLPEMNESSVWGCSQRQADSTGVTNGLSLKTKPPLFSMSYFKDVSPLDGSRVSCLWKARGLKKTECTLWAIPRHLPPLLTSTQPKVMSHFLSSIFQEQPVMVSPKEKKKKSVSGQKVLGFSTFQMFKPRQQQSVLTFFCLS